MSLRVTPDTPIRSYAHLKVLYLCSRRSVQVIASTWFRDGLRRLLGDRPGDSDAWRSELQHARVSVFRLADIQVSFAPDAS